VDVLVRAGRQRQLIELLYDGVVGMAIVAWPCPEGLSGELEVLMQMRERAVLACAPSHPLARLAEITGDMVASLAQPLLVMQWWLELPRDVVRLAERAQPAVDVPMDTGRYMVLHGAGAGIFPWLQVADAIAAGALREVPVVDAQPLVRDSALVRRVGSPPLGRAARDLVEELARRAMQLQVLTD